MNIPLLKRPRKKGWLQSYMDFIDLYSTQNQYISKLRGELIGNNVDENMYRVVQPTGMMYGHAIRTPGQYDLNMARWDEKEKMKLIVADSFVNNAILLNNDRLTDADMGDLVNGTLKELIEFYINMYPGLAKYSTDYFGKMRTDVKFAEQIVEKRLEVRWSWKRNFWAGFFHNSLLFLDVYFFNLWMQQNRGIVSITSFEMQQENLRLFLLKVIAAAAHANNEIEQEEQQLFKFFLQSAHLPSHLEEEAKYYMKHKISIDDIEGLKNYSWIVRKYLLELAILTIWSDKTVEESEKDFIHKLATKLRFSSDEVESSMLAIESFVITNWEQVHFLQSRHDFYIIKERFSMHMAQALKRNKRALAKEIQESKELMELLMKWRKHNLNDIEKEKVKCQLIDILKTLPTFVIVALPGTFITLPVLLKILPKAAFPSAFSEDHDD